MDPIISVLSQLGLGVATNAIYDLVKARLSGPNPVSVEQLKLELQNVINMNGITLRADKLIEALATNGILQITNSHLHASERAVLGSNGGAAVFGHNSQSTTRTTAIQAGPGAWIQFSGNAQIEQAEDGSIIFKT